MNEAHIILKRMHTMKNMHNSSWLVSPGPPKVRLSLQRLLHR